ncbi:replication factor-a protein [Pleurotus eryngii]|uniref:Replication protein A subunit n=1 Tax=Pleurotus eryngii TaxID=5323 RepID=A0A9P6AAY9_PLEER|nr:replication factor-a protein [Pleurotus eryngii]
MSFQLTSGICARLHSPAPSDADTLNQPCTLQLLSVKKVSLASANQPTDRYRIIISDGVNYAQAMLATQLNNYVTEGRIAKNTVAKLTKMTSNSVQDKRLIIILGLEVLALDVPKIGDPKALPDASAPGGSTVTTPSNVASPAPPRPPMQPSNQNTPPPHNQAPSKSSRHGSIYPIEGLSPYQNNWTIKARVTQKSDIKHWSNQRGEGKLFSVTLMDDSAEIKGTAFNTVVDDLYPKLEEGKVYYISKARVNLAKKKFSNLTNDYELSFEKHTEIEECHEVSNVPMVKYNFVPLSGLEELAKDSTCDVIGIVKEVAPLSEIISKASSRSIPKRELTLVDKSGFSVRLTLWGKQAESYNADDAPVIAFKGVKVGDFGGRSLSMFSSSTMTVNPDIEEAFALRGWYDAYGADQSFHSHSSVVSTNSGGGFNRSEMRNLSDIKESQLGTEKVDYFSARATIMHIKSDNISYPACPTQDCNKKVVQEGDQWRCEKCDKSFPRPEYRYIISMAVADWSGQAWLQGFNDVGVAIFGMTANDLIEKRDRNEAEFNSVMQKATCQTYNFACRAKQDTYNDQTRVRYGITKISPLDYKEEIVALVGLLRSPWAL